MTRDLQDQIWVCEELLLQNVLFLQRVFLPHHKIHLLLIPHISPVLHLLKHHMNPRPRLLRLVFQYVVDYSLLARHIIVPVDFVQQPVEHFFPMGFAQTLHQLLYRLHHPFQRLPAQLSHAFVRNLPQTVLAVSLVYVPPHLHLLLQFLYFLLAELLFCHILVLLLFGCWKNCQLFLQFNCQLWRHTQYLLLAQIYVKSFDRRRVIAADPNRARCAHLCTGQLRTYRSAELVDKRRKTHFGFLRLLELMCNQLSPILDQLGMIVVIRKRINTRPQKIIYNSYSLRMVSINHIMIKRSFGQNLTRFLVLQFTLVLKMPIKIRPFTNFRMRISQIILPEGTEMTRVQKGLFGFLVDGQQLFIGLALDRLPF